MKIVRSGHVRPDYGSMRAIGEVNYNWSSIAAVYSAGTWAARAYYLKFSVSGTNPVGSDARWYGIPVRCLVYKLPCYNV